ncbi:MAG: 1-pyrroline-2-carboxylate reductase [NAD(P)H] [Enterobacterales bacterium]|jgi:1-pyrroline-2-carboxylate reductase [NAD(P)H]
MLIIDKHQVHQSLSFNGLIDALAEGFSEEYHMPIRQVFELLPGDPSHNAFAVLPAWNERVIGVKAFTYFPTNATSTIKGLESIYSKIMLFSRNTGEPLALVDGTRITLWRTACVSGLASRYLSREDSTHLLLLGTGNLATYMIEAHLAVRNISTVSIWGRDENKASDLVATMQAKYKNIDFSVAQSIEENARKADIISCATGSPKPLILGEWLKPGAHLDLIGNHHADRRECDTLAITRAQVYVDSKANVLNEAGELLIPIAEGDIDESHVKGELADLCKGIIGNGNNARQNQTDITLFKSVGTALSDLIAADYVFNHQANVTNILHNESNSESNTKNATE